MHVLAAGGGYVDWSALWKIVVVGLLAGAGLTTVYSLGILLLSRAGAGDGEATAGAARPHLVTWVGAVLCFLVVLGGIAYGIDTMLAK